MHRFTVNFRKSARDRAAEISARAYNHYLRFKPIVGKIYRPLRELPGKYLARFYGQNKKGSNFPP